MDFMEEEYFDKMNYSVVVNRQLDRAIEARSKAVPPNNRTATAYVMAVEALYTSLLPSLRGRAGEAIQKAREALSIAAEIEQLEKTHPTKAHETPRGRELYDRLEKLANEILGDDKGFFFNPYHFAMQVADVALELMLASLNGAGLLLRGRVVQAGYMAG